MLDPNILNNNSLPAIMLCDNNLDILTQEHYKTLFNLNNFYYFHGEAILLDGEDYRFITGRLSFRDDQKTYINNMFNKWIGLGGQSGLKYLEMYFNGDIIYNLDGSIEGAYDLDDSILRALDKDTLKSLLTTMIYQLNQNHNDNKRIPIKYQLTNYIIKLL
jgi:hypothetical protein